MNIEWNRVTWYSKLAAVVFFIGILPTWTFYLGTQYEKTAIVLVDPGVSLQIYNGHVNLKPAVTPITLNSGVEGTVTIGPTCPVERMPPDPACANKSYSTTLLLESNITYINGKKISLNIHTDDKGHFSFQLAPGTYTLRSGNSVTPPTLAPTTFTVKPNATTTLSLIFDSGIR